MPEETVKTEPKASEPRSSDPRMAAELRSTERLGLEEIVHIANRIGLDYVEAKKKSERLDLLRASVRARIMMRHDDGSLSEAKLRRLSETDEEYLAFLEEYSIARAEAERLRIRYESYKNLFEAKRSLLSYQKAEMKLI